MDLFDRELLGSDVHRPGGTPRDDPHPDPGLSEETDPVAILDIEGPRLTAVIVYVNLAIGHDSVHIQQQKFDPLALFIKPVILFTFNQNFHFPDLYDPHLQDIMKMDNPLRPSSSVYHDQGCNGVAFHYLNCQGRQGVPGNYLRGWGHNLCRSFVKDVG